MRIKLFFILLSFTPILTFSASIDTVLVYSESMEKEISNIVILPDSYSSSHDAMPVLYLLHGAGDTYKSWLIKVPNLVEQADLYNMIIVCPDGGHTSWYFDSPVDPGIRYETYITKELIAAIDNKFNTIPQAGSRAISGVSMGGHGAFYLAFRHQDLYGAAGSMSGGMDIRPFPENWDLPKRLGSYVEQKENWENNTVINLVDLIIDSDLKIIFDCGVDDFFFDVNNRMHEKLIVNNIPHDYIARPGAHDWDYRVNAIKYQLLFFHEFFYPPVD